MLHPVVLRDLLRSEADVARGRLGSLADSVTVDDSSVTVTFTIETKTWHARFDGSSYDQMPLSLSFVDANGVMLPGDQWPKIVYGNGSPHPVTGKPWVCMQGLLEYHLFAGHTEDAWDINRADHRLQDVADHIITGCAA